MSDLIQTTAEAAENAVFPEAGAVHSDPNMPLTTEKCPLPHSVSKTPVEKKSPAEWAYERLILYIQKFEEMLDSDHEVAMGFAGGEMGVLRIEGMGFFAPDIVTFYGNDTSGTKTQLVQHVTQLNVMLRALPKAAGIEKPNRIGFRLVADLGRADAEERDKKDP